MKSKMLQVENISVGFNDRVVLHNLRLDLLEGELACLLGPSGCGKTTLLRAIAGFEPVSQGQIQLCGECISRPGYYVAPEKRRIGMMFQQFALFPHLSVGDNIRFGIRQYSRNEQNSRARALLELVELPDVEARYPHTLSGGQQQRVALARALAPHPRLLLMDEPFSSMDNDLREGIAAEVRAILKREGITALLVTHDQNEAFALADNVAVMHQGGIEQIGDARSLYHHPQTRFVAEFIGDGSFIRGTLHSDGGIETPLGRLQGSSRSGSSKSVEVFIRPEQLTLQTAQENTSPYRAVVTESLFRGQAYLYTLKLSDGQQIKALDHTPVPVRPGTQVGLQLQAQHEPSFVAM